MDRKTGQRRFSAGRAAWRSALDGGHIHVLEDDEQQMEPHVRRLTRLSYTDRKRTSKDLGETMVVVHACVFRDADTECVLYIDDGGGQKLAAQEDFTCLATENVLAQAARQGFISTRGEMKKLYALMRPFDDGLQAFDSSQLSSKSLYR